MGLPDVKQFTEILLREDLDTVVSTHLFQGEVFAFRRTPTAYATLRSHLNKTLGVPDKDVIVVGSAKTGFSVSPDGFPSPFSAISDIDVVVVDRNLFDTLWLTLLTWSYPHRVRGGEELSWIGDRRKNVFQGWFQPGNLSIQGLSRKSTLTPVREFSTRWFNAFRELSTYPEFVTRDVHGRLYRSWQHAMLYHVDGLEKLKGSLQGTLPDGDL